MRPIHRGACLVSMLIALAAPITEAAVVTVEAVGTVTFVENSSGLLPAGIAAANPGDPFLIRYFIENTATTDTNASPNAGNYPLALVAMSVVINSTSFVIPSDFNASKSVVVFDDLFLSGFGVFRDAVVVTAMGCQTESAGLCASGSVQFLNSSATSPATPLSSDSMLLFPTDLSQFEVTSLNLAIGPGPTTANPVFDQIGGTITSVSIVAPVPLPGAVWLLLSGIGALWTLARRRRSPAVAAA